MVSEARNPSTPQKGIAHRFQSWGEARVPSSDLKAHCTALSCCSPTQTFSATFIDCGSPPPCPGTAHSGKPLLWQHWWRGCLGALCGEGVGPVGRGATGLRADRPLDRHDHPVVATGSGGYSPGDARQQHRESESLATCPTDGPYSRGKTSATITLYQSPHGQSPPPAGPWPGSHAPCTHPG